MKARWAALVASLVAVGSCGGERRAAPEPTYVALEGEVARVGDVAVPSTLVGDVARARAAPAQVALGALVDDALAAQGARADGLDRGPGVRWASTVATGREVPRRLWEAARAEGAPTDDELSLLQVVHAVILRSHSLPEARALFLAHAVADAVAHARTSAEFQERAAGATGGDVRTRVEEIAPFDAAGQTADGQRLDPEFTAAAFALHTPGETSPVVESPFGWHVIRLLSRGRPPETELARRRADLAEDVVGLRARGRLVQLLTDRRERTRIEISGAAEELLAQLAPGR